MNIQPFVPHQGPMSLLDSIEEHGEETLTAAVEIRPGATFEQDGSVPAWVGIEYMAQAIAAYAGVIAHEAGEAVKPGFLIGIRKFTSDIPAFPVGSNLQIKVERVVMGENGLGVFDCQIYCGEQQANAKLNVFQPDNIEQFME